jgi:hypothetical protein
MNVMQDLPHLAATLSRLIPAADREAILGDLLEDAAYRDLTGAFLTLWLCGQCSAIAAGLTVDRMRHAFAVPPLREMVSGLALDGTHALRDALDAPWTLLVRAIVFCATVATLTIVVELLIAALFSASGLVIVNPSPWFRNPRSSSRTRIASRRRRRPITRRRVGHRLPLCSSATENSRPSESRY